MAQCNLSAGAFKVLENDPDDVIMLTSAEVQDLHEVSI